MNTIVCRYLSKLFVAYVNAIHQQKAVGKCNVPLLFVTRFVFTSNKLGTGSKQKTGL